MNFALVALFNIVFAGVTFILYGLAVASSNVYPRWLGWPVVVAGIGSIAVGVVQAQVGESTGISRVASIVFPTIITLWVAALGVLLLRRAPRLDSSSIQAESSRMRNAPQHPDEVDRPREVLASDCRGDAASGTQPHSCSIGSTH